MSEETTEVKKRLYYINVAVAIRAEDENEDDRSSSAGMYVAA